VALRTTLVHATGTDDDDLYSEINQDVALRPAGLIWARVQRDILLVLIMLFSD